MSNFVYLETGISSLDTLFLSEESGGVGYLKTVGLFGIIFGAAGSGKSILALQLCAGFANGGLDGQGGVKEARHAVYVTHEPPEIIRVKLEEHFKFVKKDCPPLILLESDLPHGWIGSSGPAKVAKSATITLVQMPLDQQEQREKLSYLFRCLNETFCWKESDREQGSDPKQSLLICVDNAETISDEAYQDVLKEPTGRRGPAFYKRVREYCGRHRLNSWFIFEEKAAQHSTLEETGISTTEQAYAADIVIRLGITVFASGYRERNFEIVKAKNQGYRRGRHHFSIRRASSAMTEAGIIIYPSLATQLHKLGNRDGAESAKIPPGEPHFLGIKEIDEAVPRADSARGYLDGGTVSVLVSDLDSLGSEIALHFALQEDRGHGTLFLSTMHRTAVLKRMIRQYKSLEERFDDKALLKDDRNIPWIRELLPEHISDSKLLTDIDKWSGGFRRVVFDNIFALSSKFPLLRDEKHFLTALFELLRHRGIAALIVDMVEVGEGRNPLDQSFIAGLADNVFTLRHVEFQSQPRKIFSVLKLAGYHEPSQLWELKERHDRIHAEDRLEFFKGILSGKPEPVRVDLSLFAETEGSPLHLYLQTQRVVLTQTFGQKIRIHTCHPDTYVAFQQSVADGNVRALGDCHVISIDEVWLEDLIANDQLVDIDLKYFGDTPEQRKPWSYGCYVTAGQDLALRRKHLRDPTPGKSAPRPANTSNLAVPDRNNVGILAYNPNIWRFRGAKPAVASYKWLHDWARRVHGGKATHNLEALPWREVEITWKHLVELQGHFLSQMGRNASIRKNFSSAHYGEVIEAGVHVRSTIKPINNVPLWGVFTASLEHRETCVSFFLELLLSVLGPDEFPVTFGGVNDGSLRWDDLKPKGADFGISPPKQEETRTAWGEALAMLLHLFTPWDLARLTAAWFRPSQIEPRCLFSRQWFSGWGGLGLSEPGLWVKELPKGAADTPTPVSGTWYLGILRGSPSVPAGARLIKHFTSPTDELHKLNRGIGLPVRETFYTAENPIEARVELPYRRQFRDLLAAQVEHVKKKKPGCSDAVLKSRSPFFRSCIRDYSRVSPLLMGMMVQAAREALHPDFSDWLWRKNMNSWPQLRERLEAIVVTSKNRYDQLISPRDP